MKPYEFGALESKSTTKLTNITPCHAWGPLTTPREVTPNATPRPSATSPTVTVRSNASVSGVPGKKTPKVNLRPCTKDGPEEDFSFGVRKFSGANSLNFQRGMSLWGGVPNKSGLEDDVLFFLSRGVLLGDAKKKLFESGSVNLSTFKLIDVRMWGDVPVGF